MKRIDQLREYPLFAGLTDTELNRLALCLVKRTFAKNAYLYYPGNPGLSMYLVESGLVRQFFCDPNGQEFLLNLVGPHETMGLPMLVNEPPRSTGAAAQSMAVVWTLARDDLLYFMERYPRFMYNIYQDVSITARKLFLLTRSLAMLDLEGRLAGVILYLKAFKLGAEHADELELPLTQAEMASWIGASRGRLNRAISSIQQRGWIRIDGQKLTILNRAGLEQLTAGLDINSITGADLDS